MLPDLVQDRPGSSRKSWTTLPPFPGLVSILRTHRANIASAERISLRSDGLISSSTPGLCSKLERAESHSALLADCRASPCDLMTERPVSAPVQAPPAGTC